MKNTSIKLRKEKYPNDRNIKKNAKQNFKAKEVNISKDHESPYTTFLLRMVRIAISILKELTEDNYLAIEKANADIRQQKALFEGTATLKAREMTSAKQNADRGGTNQNAWNAWFEKARSEYIAFRSDTKGKISQKINEAILNKREIQICADNEITFCEEKIALYWQIAKKYFNRLDACPPSFFSLMDIAKVSIPDAVIENDRLYDVAEYPGNNEDPQLTAETDETNNKKYRDSKTVLPFNGNGRLEFINKIKEVM